MSAYKLTFELPNQSGTAVVFAKSEEHAIACLYKDHPDFDVCQIEKLTSPKEGARIVFLHLTEYLCP